MLSDCGENMADTQPIPWTFDAFLQADLERVYQQGKDEVLRDRAFKILLGHAGTVKKLEQFAFEGERKVTGWSTNELLDISNRFRLMSSPENEIRLYRECGNEAFRSAPRVREFYVLALVKAGRPAEALREGATLIAQGGQNALVWGALAQSHMARVQFAEHLLSVMREAGDTLRITGPLSQQLQTIFPDIHQDALSAATVRMLRERDLAHAARIFKQSFIESANPYPGLGWMYCTLDQLCNMLQTRNTLQDEQASWLISDHRAQIDILESQVAQHKHALQQAGRLLEVSLALQGGDESQDYWTHAGYLRLAVLGGARIDDFNALLARALASGDAAFKHTIVIRELQRVRRQLDVVRQSDGLAAGEAHALAMQAQCAELAIAALETARNALEAGTRSAALSHTAGEGKKAPADVFKANTINFHALVGNLVPVFIPGTIGKVGARVPDLLINRQVQHDLADLIESQILPGLPAAQRADPRAILQRIQRMVGRDLNIAALQDLQSPSHAAFDMRSDGMIALSGVDPDLRKDTLTSTELTATLLMQTGDCRETMYLNGALFASWQHLAVKRALARAIQCLDLHHDAGFEAIVGHEIPALLRYQLRGGQVNVYVDGIAMQARYKYARAEAGDTPLERVYGMAEWRAGQPLSRYELENSILEVRHARGDVSWIEPKDPRTGQWRPMAHAPAAEGSEGGVPVIPNDADRIRLLNQVEAHAMTFLFDTQDETVELCDGFYNERLFNSPYAFSAGRVDLAPLVTSGLIQAGTRDLMQADGRKTRRAVFLQFTHYSPAQYATGLVAGDAANSLQFMGRTYHTDFKHERSRLEEGASPIPALLEKIQAWQAQRSQQRHSERSTLERQLTRLMLELAKAQPEALQLRDVTLRDSLIREGAENQFVYLVLSGSLRITRDDAPLRDAAGNPITVSAGGLVGEISALRGMPATATVRGEAVVLAITQREIRNQLQQRPQLLNGLEDLASYRLSELADNGYRSG
jgi:hypothetical protein